jgi:hypothetical protein
VYDISATDQHTKPVYWLIELTMQTLGATPCAESETPNLASADIDRGFAHYRDRCLRCHGGPARAPTTPRSA